MRRSSAALAPGERFVASRGMIRKSGHRFSDKIMPKRKKAGLV
jgi:hypothetical protein